jgi:hypothetical protein
MEKFVHWFLSEKSKQVDIFKLFHWRENILKGEDNRVTVCGENFFVPVHEGIIWGFWHHQFVRVKVLREVFGMETPPRSIDAVQTYMHEIYKDDFRVNPILS